ncbi:MAG: hypothetical protein AABP62_10425 [Planctomycetota bacterium]
MLLIKNSEVAQAKQPLDYEEACSQYSEWSEQESAKEGEILLGVPQPNRGLSKVVGSTWRLRNVNGPLASVGSNGRVWQALREDN